MELVQFDPETLERRSPAQRAVLAGFLAWGLERACSVAGSSDIEEVGADDEGIHVHVAWNESRRNCFVGREQRCYSVPWAVLLSEQDLGDWRRHEEVRQEEEAIRLARIQAEEQRANQAIRAEEARRAEYLRLRAEFEPDDRRPRCP